nr:hypothetical protein [uncultured Desulfuromonas sp.]
MKLGNWIPIDKGLLRYLPHNRPFTELEAAFSLQVDYDQGTPVSVAGYAAQWQWSRNKVYRFFKQLGVEIEYPDSTGKKQNQKGQIAIQIRGRSTTKRVQIRLIDSKDLDDEPNRCEEKRGQIRDRSRNTTKDPNPNPKKQTPFFDEFWTLYPRKVSKKAAQTAWKKLQPDEPLFKVIISGLEKHILSDQWQKDEGRFIPHPATWLNQERWNDEIAQTSKTNQDSGTYRSYECT